MPLRMTLSPIIMFIVLTSATVAQAATTQAQQATVEHVRTLLTTPGTFHVDFYAPPGGVLVESNSYTSPVAVAGLEAVARPAATQVGVSRETGIYLSKAREALNRRAFENWMLTDFALSRYRAPNRSYAAVWKNWVNGLVPRYIALGWHTNGMHGGGTDMSWRFEQSGPGFARTIYIALTHTNTTPRLDETMYVFHPRI